MKNSQYRRRGSLRRHGIPDSPLVRAHLDTRNVLYIRASTEDQKLTLEGQEFEGREWSELRGLTTEQAFIEPGVSGSKPFLERKEAMRAIEYMEKHGIPTLLVMDQDRGFRDTFDLLQTVDYLLEKGICLRLATPDIVIFDPYTRFVATVLAAVGELQLGQIKKNQKRAFNQMRRDKVALSQNPSFGWQLGEEIPDQVSKSGKPYRRLEPVPEEQEILREIIARYEAKETLQRIADDLNARGIRTKLAGKTQIRKGKPITISGEWKPQTIKSVIEHAELA